MILFVKPRTIYVRWCPKLDLIVIKNQERIVIIQTVFFEVTPILNREWISGKYRESALLKTRNSNGRFKAIQKTHYCPKMKSQIFNDSNYKHHSREVIPQTFSWALTVWHDRWIWQALFYENNEISRCRRWNTAAQHIFCIHKPRYHQFFSRPIS